MKELVISDVSQRIQSIRGRQIVLDRDLAEFYHTRTKSLNQAVRRNQDRFPIEFMFQLSETEAALAVAVSPEREELRGGTRTLPYGFTQEGAVIVSGILKSKRALQVNTLMMRAFFQVKETSGTNLEVEKRLIQIESYQVEQLKMMQAIYANQIALSGGFNELRQDRLVQIPTDTKESNAERRNATITQNMLHRRMEAIQKSVADYYGLSVREMNQRSRLKTIALPRQIAIYLIREHTKIGFKEIGNFFGGKDHTTILHAFRKISTAVKNDNIIREAVQAIEATFTK